MPKKKKKINKIAAAAAAAVPLETKIRNEVTIKIIAGIILLMTFRVQTTEWTKEKRKICARERKNYKNDWMFWMSWKQWREV